MARVPFFLKNEAKSLRPESSVKFDLIAWEGGSLKRSLGTASEAFTIPKTSGFEAATRSQAYNLQIHA